MATERRIPQKGNKEKMTTWIRSVAVARECVKPELQNIVFPKWSDLGLLGVMFRQYVVTKEQPDGNLYDEAVFQTVMRVIGGKVLMSGRPDCYCWKFDKIANAKNVRLIGTNSAEGLLSLCEVLSGIEAEEEKNMLADMFANMKKDLLLVTTPEEKRRCIEVTPSLYEKGLTSCVDEWMEVDEEGNAPVTNLFVGDFLIVTENGVYRIGREEFLQTHKLL